jgi:hypothetical protein
MSKPDYNMAIVFVDDCQSAQIHACERQCAPMRRKSSPATSQGLWLSDAGPAIDRITVDLPTDLKVAPADLDCLSKGQRIAVRV